jgi:hypothetical protein
VAVVAAATVVAAAAVVVTAAVAVAVVATATAAAVVAAAVVAVAATVVASAAATVVVVVVVAAAATVGELQLQPRLMLEQKAPRQRGFLLPAFRRQVVLATSTTLHSRHGRTRLRCTRTQPPRRAPPRC